MINNPLKILSSMLPDCEQPPLFKLMYQLYYTLCPEQHAGGGKYMGDWFLAFKDLKPIGGEICAHETVIGQLRPLRTPQWPVTLVFTVCFWSPPCCLVLLPLRIPEGVVVRRRPTCGSAGCLWNWVIWQLSRQTVICFEIKHNNELLTILLSCNEGSFPSWKEQFASAIGEEPPALTPREGRLELEEWLGANGVRSKAEGQSQRTFPQIWVWGLQDYRIQGRFQVLLLLPMATDAHSHAAARTLGALLCLCAACPLLPLTSVLCMCHQPPKTTPHLSDQPWRQSLVQSVWTPSD